MSSSNRMGLRSAAQMESGSSSSSSSSNLEAPELADCEIFDPKNEEESLSVDEHVNLDQCRELVKVLKELWSATTDTHMVTVDDFFLPVREVIYPFHNDPTDLVVVSFAEERARNKHKEECPRGVERRMVLLPKPEMLGKWPLGQYNSKQYAALFDEFITQHLLNTKQECCPVYAVLSRTHSAVLHMAHRLNRLLLADRQLILMQMKQTCHLDEDTTARLLKPDTGVVPAAIAGGAVGTLIPQLIIPAAAIDLSEKNVLAMMRFVSQSISSGLDPRVKDWSSEIKIHIGNTVYARIESPVLADKVLWQHYKGPQLLELLKSFLPSDHKLSKEKEIGRTALQVFTTFLQDNRFEVTFEETLRGYHDITSLKSLIEIEYDKLEAEGGIQNPNDERVMAKKLWREFYIYGLQQSSRKELQMEIELKCEKVYEFIPVLELINKVVIDKFRMLMKARDFMGPKSERKRVPDGPENHPKKRRGADKESHKSLTRVTDSERSTVCIGCGWDTRSNKPKTRAGAIAPPESRAIPTVYRCMRGKDKEGCGSDPRRSTAFQPWAESPVGIEWKAAGYNALPKDISITLDNAKERFINPKEKSLTEAQKWAGKFACMINDCNNMLQHSELIPFSVLNVQAPRSGLPRSQGIGARHSAPAYKLLLDTGAIGSCVVSTAFLSSLQSAGIEFHTNAINHQLNTATNETTISNQEISFEINLQSENSSIDKPIQLKIKAIVAPIGVDLIIDKAMIKQYQLVQHFPSHFVEGKMLDVLTATPIEVVEGNQPTAKRKATPSKSAIKTAKRLKKIEKRRSNRVDILKDFCSSAHNMWVEKQRKLTPSRGSTQKDILEAGEKLTSYLATLDTRTLVKTLFTDFSDIEKTNTLLYNITSNFSSKSAYERDGNLHDIPDNKMESIPAELVSDVHDTARMTTRKST